MPVVRSSTETIDGKAIDIFIEVDRLPSKPSPYDDTRSARPVDVVAAARDMFDDGIALARACAQKVVAGIKLMDEAVCPEEFEMKLAIMLDAEAGAVITKVGAGAQLEITMKWKPKA